MTLKPLCARAMQHGINNEKLCLIQLGIIGSSEIYELIRELRRPSVAVTIFPKTYFFFALFEWTEAGR